MMRFDILLNSYSCISSYTCIENFNISLEKIVKPCGKQSTLKSKSMSKNITFSSNVDSKWFYTEYYVLIRPKRKSVSPKVTGRFSEKTISYKTQPNFHT